MSNRPDAGSAGSAYVPDLRRSIGACLLGEALGDGTGVNVLTVADLLIERLPSMGWSFVREGGDRWVLPIEKRQIDGRDDG